MTKAKALKQLLEYSRDVIEPAFASKLAKAFGYTLNQLKIKPRSLSNFDRLMYNPESASIKAISVRELAEALVWQMKEKTINNPMYGAGSGADYVVEKAVEILK